MERRLHFLSVLMIATVWMHHQLMVDGFSSSHQRLFGTTLPASSTVNRAPATTGILGVGYSRYHRPLFAEEEEGEAAAASEDASNEEGEEAAAGSEEEEEAPEEEQEEDPEMKALREEIDELERELRRQKNVLQGLNDQSALYSEKGYARKVAQMENLRRSNQSAQSSNEGTAIAVVLQSFVPVLEELEAKKEAYEDMEFGKQYTALSLLSTFSDLGVTMFDAGSPGDQVVAMKVATTAEEYNESIPKGCVVSTVKPGLELKGNVIRMAEAVVSLGKEGEKEEEAAAEESVEEDSGEESD